MDQKNILIIEDDRPIREMMKSLLEVEGYNVTTAANGSEGIEAVHKLGRQCVVLLDMMMPVMNGWDFLDEVRGDPVLADIPVVVVSAYREIAKSVRPQAYVPKPIQLNTLLKAIEECAA